MGKILIVEDDLIVARDIRQTLERNGYAVLGTARSVDKAQALIALDRPWFVLIDIFLKGESTGIDLARQLQADRIPFIYISANSNQRVLEAAKATRPYGFIVKPFREKDLLVSLDIARYRHETERIMGPEPSPAETTPPKASGTVSYLPVQPRKKAVDCTDLVGRSSAMLQVFQLIDQVAPFDTSVLLMGETGTGKEGVAACLRALSPRASKPYIRINCAAVPESLMEAELFGYEKGAFTGASMARAGKFEQAAGGTMLLDEIGELPMDMQAKLLRVLQEKEVQRIGGTGVIRTDVRIVAATSRHLEREVAEGRFRLDLYYRLHVFPIVLPPLRDRAGDVALLVDHFTGVYAQKTGKVVTGMDSATLKQLSDYRWPGNVRELQHLIERAVLLTRGPILGPEILDWISSSATDTTGRLSATATQERDRIISVLNKCSFRITGKDGAAVELGISPASLRDKIKAFNIQLFHQ